MLTRAGSKTGIVTAVALAALGAGCRKQAGLSDQGQIGAAVGEVMASADSVRLAVRFTLSPTVAMLQAAASLKVRLTEPATVIAPTLQLSKVAVRTPAVQAE